jgi:1-acyl-sn-glycerol-3-phosphate acyltransferase
MKFLRNILQRIYFVYAFTIFLLIMLLIFLPIIVASLWGRVRGGNLVYRLIRFWSDSVLSLIFIFGRRIFEVPHDPGQSYIFVVNHVSFLDAGFLPHVFRQPLRILGKAEMARIPVFGFIYSRVVVTVLRNNIEDRARSMSIIKSLVNKKISVLIFPEGTFNNTGKPLKEFYNGAFRIAIETQTPIKPVLFLDTYSRIPASLSTINPGRCRAVFLDEIPVTGLTLDDVPMLNQKTHQIMSDKLREYGAHWITEKREVNSIR